MLVSQFLDALQRYLPLDLAMPDDPVGVQVMTDDTELATVAIAYEASEAVVSEAVESGAQVIVAFHPLIYPALARVTNATRVERTVIELIRNRIALYVVHTAFDAHPDGTSALLARALGLSSIVPLVPSPRFDGAGMGAIGRLDTPRTVDAFAELLRATTHAPAVRVSAPPVGVTASKTIESVAILGGSGMSFYDRAVAAGVDALVTADVRYHGFHAANDHIPVFDPGHAESECFVAAGIAALVERVVAGQTDAVRVTTLTAPTNPVRFVV